VAYGVRITLADWIVGKPTGYDLFVPWTNLESALIATPAHSVRDFAKEAAKWKKRMCGETDENNRKVE
jgi:hypothetical protein